jgi:hypothetical protein
MPKFLEKKLKAHYGESSEVPYKIMNALGYMHGSKETPAGKAAQKKHEKDSGTLLEHRWYYATDCPSGRIPFPYLIERLNAMATEQQIMTLQIKFIGLILTRDWTGLRNLLACSPQGGRTEDEVPN